MKKDEDYFLGDEGQEPEEPEKEDVGPTFNDVFKHSLVPTDSGLAIDVSRMGELEGRYGYNGGRGCDVQIGHCSCGAAHTKQDNKQLNPDWAKKHSSQK